MHCGIRVYGYGGGIIIQLGEKQKMVVVKTVDFGVYVAPDMDETENRVLLPKKQVPEGIKKDRKSVV